MNLALQSFFLEDMNILFYFRMKELKTIYHLKLQIETGLKAKSERADFLSHLLRILTSSEWRRTWNVFWIQGQTAIKSYLWNDRVLKKTTTQLSPKHIHESFFELIKSEIFKKSHQNAANFQKHILLRNLMQSAIAQNAANFLLKTGHP